MDTTKQLSDDLKKLTETLADEHKKTTRARNWLLAFAVPLGIAIMPVLILWHAFVTAKLWAWFGEPVFHVHLSAFAVGGLTIFARLLCLPSGMVKSSERTLITDLLLPAVALGVGAFWYWLGWGL